MTPETQPADRGVRRLAIVITVIGTVVGLLVIMFVQSRLTRLDPSRMNDPRELAHSLRPLVWILTIGFAVPVIGVAAYLWRFATRIVADDRFPPIGARLTQDVTVLHGRDARHRALLFKVVAVVLSLAAVGFVTILWRLAALVER